GNPRTRARAHLCRTTRTRSAGSRRDVVPIKSRRTHGREALRMSSPAGIMLAHTAGLLADDAVVTSTRHAAVAELVWLRVVADAAVGIGCLLTLGAFALFVHRLEGARP